MGPRLQRLTAEAAKFSAVNVLATVVAIVLFNIAVHGVAPLSNPGPLNEWPLTAWFLANCVGMAISYAGSRHFAFRHREPRGPANGAVRYVVINLASFVIPMTCLWLTRNVLDWDSAVADNVSGNVVGAFLGMLFRFWAFKRFVFKRRTGSLLARPEVGPDETQLVEHQA